MQNESKQQELMLQEAQMDLQRYQIDQDNQTKIAVAQINAYRGTEELDQDQNGIPDPIEIVKLHYFSPTVLFLRAVRALSFSRS
jgi:hypothetical protein